MSKAYRSFSESKGGTIMNTKLTDLIDSLKRRVTASKELVNSMYYDEVPEEAKKEIANVPQNLQKGLFEGMSIAYEKIIIDLESVLESDDNDKMVYIEGNIEKYQKITELFKGKIEKDEVDFRSGYFQGEMSAYQVLEEEIKMIFNIRGTDTYPLS